MVRKLEELVHFTGDDPALVARAREAVEWIYDKPEGWEILEKTYELHGAKLEIVVNPTIDSTSYEHDDHSVRVNPNLDSAKSYNDVEGGNHPCSLERQLAHEFYHAAHPIDPASRRSYSFSLVMAAMHAQDAAYIFPLPTKGYEHRIEAAGNDPVKLSEIYGEIFDKYTKQISKAKTKAINRDIYQNGFLGEYYREHESPTIEFENRIMAYRGEASRNIDYLENPTLLNKEYDLSRDREASIEAAVAKRIELLAIQVVTGHDRDGRDPREIRSDAGGKNSGDEVSP